MLRLLRGRQADSDKRSTVHRLAAENARLRSENGALQATVAEQHTTISALQATSATLLERIAMLERLVEELQAKLGINSRNSSKPPSSDGPGTAPRPAKKKRGRKPGGQPGHAGTTRTMAPIEQVDVVKDIRPVCCEGCGTLLLGEDPAPLRRQMIEIPPPKVIVTEYRLHRLGCLACGCMTQAEAPVGLPGSVFGATVHALSALLVGRFRQSKRLVVELFDVLYGLTLSPGKICAMEQRVSAALEVPVDEARATLRTEEVVGKDETGRPLPHQSQCGSRPPISSQSSRSLGAAAVRW